MSNFIRWTRHPDTGHWHHAYWMDNHFGGHRYGVKFNDGMIVEADKEKLETSEKMPGDDEIIDSTRDQFKEVFGHKEGEDPMVRRVYKYGTGDNVPKDATYLTTVVEEVLGNRFVWHYFSVEVKDD